ncbi:hypothetical protein NKG94_47325 [Micromonospora sp. M12]
MTAKDVAAGRSQLCALLQDGFDLSATGPNGDFADHFQVPEAAITGIRSDPQGRRSASRSRSPSPSAPSPGRWCSPSPGTAATGVSPGGAGQAGRSVAVGSPHRALRVAPTAS